jgi:hypothetical protein
MSDHTAVRTSVLAAIAALATAGAVLAADPAQPYTETFGLGTANWHSGIFTTPDHVPAGGMDGSSYISTTLDLASGSGFGLTAFRAQLDLGSSDGMFAGDYLAGGLTHLSFQIRHNAPEALAGFVRFAWPNNGPAVAWFFDAIPAGEWTQVTLHLSTDNPNFIPAGGEFVQVMSDVGNLAFAFSVPTGMAGMATFDIDNVSTGVPGPGSVLGLAPLGVMAIRRRRAR